MRLATKLAANASPCAQYFFSIPSLADDHTQVRSDQAWRIRALGSQFHAMAEISMSAWGTWVADNSSTWYEAGVEARRRMAAAGYDVSLGDTWAVNEFSSAVRQGTGTARADARNFVHGLYDGDGTLPRVRGTVFISGMGQGTLNFSVYKPNVEGWLSDSPFWADMNRYVSDWSQELYGDYRNYGVAGAQLATRRDYLNDYLQHVILHANVGPDAAATARTYLQTAYSPLANAAWQWDAAYGWTLVSAAQMEDYVSAQTYALRYYSATTQPTGADHWGFAWAPKNTSAMATTDFNTQSGEIIDRLAAAIHDSDHSADPTTPGSNACGTTQSWCVTDISGAWFNDGWKTFRYWGQSALAFTTPSQTLTAGSPSGAITVQLQASGTPQAASSDVAVNLSSSSAQGSFSTTAGGPWTGTLSVTIPAGSSTSAGFYYDDTKAGSPTLAASATGMSSGTQTETVNPGPLATLTVSPGTASVTVGGTQIFTAGGADAYGNVVATSDATWALTPAGLGTIAPTAGSSTTFTAGATAGSGTLVAAAAGISGSASITVTTPAKVPGPPQLTAAPAASKGVSLSWTAPASDGGSPISGYRIYRARRPGAEALLVSVGNVTGYTDTSTRKGVTYYYTVTAANAVGEGPASNEASATAR